MRWTADEYLGSTLHDAHHLSCLEISDDSNGVLVDRVEGNELGALIVVPQGGPVLIALCQHLNTARNMVSAQRRINKQRKEGQQPQHNCTMHTRSHSENMMKLVTPVPLIGTTQCNYGNKESAEITKECGAQGDATAAHHIDGLLRVLLGTESSIFQHIFL